MAPSPVPTDSFRREILLLLPLLLAIGFVQTFARALPLTDEWFYVRAIRRLHDVNWHSLAGLGQAIQLFPTRFNEHLVSVPFLAYWPLAEAAHFDSRWIISLTVAAFAVQAWIFRHALVRPTWALFPIVLVLFCPSHFMEFLWGWQITLSFSVMFPLLGLAIIDRIADHDNGRALSGLLVAGIG